MANPYINFPFARNGNKEQIADTREDGVVNFNQGYGDDYSRQLGVDPSAKAIERTGQNWLFNVLSENIIEWQLGAFPMYLAQRAYAVNAYCRYTAGAASSAKLYRCLKATTAGIIPTNKEYWEEVLTSAQTLLLVPMPYQSIIAVATDFNTLVQNGTWTFDSQTVLSASTNAPSNSTPGILETRLTGLGADSLVQRFTSQSGGVYVRGRNAAGNWMPWITAAYPVPIAQGGTGATTALDARNNLGLGSAAVRNIYTSGDNVPLMSAANTWSGFQTFTSSGGIRMNTFGGNVDYGRIYLGSGAAFIEYTGSRWAVGNPVTGAYTIIEGGGTTWTSGNFNPGSKVNLAGDTMTGGLTINNQALRVSGWLNVATNGVVYFGSGESFIYKNGTAFTFQNAQGNYSATLNAGGTIYTTANLSPVSKTGDTMSGNLLIQTASTESTALTLINTSNGGRSYSVFSNGSASVTGAAGSWGVYDNTAAATRISCGPTGAWLIPTLLEIRNGSTNATYLTLNNQASNGHSWTLASSGGGPAAAGAFTLYDNTVGGARMTINAAGNTSFAGSVTPAGGFDFGSSLKLKDIDGAMPYGLAEVRRVETLIGRYKPEYNDDGVTRLFFNAEQLQTLIPEMVNPEGVEFEGEQVASVKLDQALPVAFKAIAELANMVDELRAEIRDLKAQR